MSVNESENAPLTVTPEQFGAVGDGRTLCTEAFARAVRACEENGGGTLAVPAGVWLCGGLRLCDDLTLRLERGAVLKAAGDFPPIGFRHNEMGETTSFLWAIGAHGVTVCGDGTVDFSSERWYPDTLTPEYSLPVGHIPPEKLCEGLLPKNESRLNQPMFFEGCERVTVEGVSLIHSPCWTLTFSRCADVRVAGIRVDNDRRIPNSDGVHFSACRDASVTDCDISCADDCVALTCITDFGGVNRNITVTDCRMSSRSAALRIGHNAEHIRVSGLAIRDTNRGIGIFTRKNSRISDVVIRDVTAETCLQAGPWWGKAEPLVICTSGEASLEDVTVENLSGECENGVFIYDPDGTAGAITLRDIDLTLKPRERFPEWCSGMDFRPYAWLDDPNGPFPFVRIGAGRLRTERVSVLKQF